MPRGELREALDGLREWEDVGAGPAGGQVEEQGGQEGEQGRLKEGRGGKVVEEVLKGDQGSQVEEHGEDGIGSRDQKSCLEGPEEDRGRKLYQRAILQEGDEDLKEDDKDGEQVQELGEKVSFKLNAFIFHSRSEP